MNEIRAEGEYRLANTYAQNENEVASRSQMYDERRGEIASGRAETRYMAQTDRDEARYLLDRKETFAVEEQNRENAFELQKAGMKLRGRTGTSTQNPMGPVGGGYSSRQAGAQPNQQAIMTGPAGVLSSSGGSDIETTTGVNEQLAKFPGQLEHDFTTPGDIGGGVGLQRIARYKGDGGPPPNAFSTMIENSSMKSEMKERMEKIVPYVGQKNGITVNQFLNELDSQEPGAKDAAYWHGKIFEARMKYQKMIMDGHQEPDLAQMRQTIAHYTGKLSANAFNPMASHSIVSDTVTTSDRAYSQAELDDMIDNPENYK
jgi:hypothetical protein